MSSQLITYRPDLQGLRAISVLLVLLFHLMPDIFKGGFVGVDAFFVISGFLITSLIVREVEATGTLRLAEFWARRMRRLLPVATLVLFVALFAALAFVPATDWINTASQTLASALYVQNWMLVAQAVDYMARESGATVVQHYWSLSIEEQFYFVWPLVVALCAYIARKSGAAIRTVAAFPIAAILVVSLIWSIVVLRGVPEAYFTTTTRAWELAIGATLAIYWPKISWSAKTRVGISWVGFAMLVTSAFVIRQGFNFPGWIALLPTLGTAFLILGNQTPKAAATLLGKQPLRYIGDISYAIYLWHWPLIVVAKQLPQMQALPLWQFNLLIIAATLTLSIITKYLIEDPFRNGILAFGLRRPRRALFIGGSFATATVLIASISVVAARTWLREEKIAADLKEKERAAIYPKSEYPGAAALDPKNPAPVPTGLRVIPNPLIAEHDMDGKHAHCMGLTGSFAIRPCEFGDRNGTKSIVLIGDSHAMQFGTALEKIAKLHAWRLVVLTKPACPFGDFPVFWEGYLRGECEHWKKESFKIITAMKPDLMITTTGRWAVYQQLPSKERQMQGYRELWQKYIDRGIRVAVIRDNPLMRGGRNSWMTPPACVHRYSKQVDECKNPRKTALEDLKDLVFETAQQMGNVPIIDLSNYFCTTTECAAVVGNVLVYRDHHHITDAYGKTLAPYLDKEVKKLIGLPPLPVAALFPASTPAGH